MLTVHAKFGQIITFIQNTKTFIDFECDHIINDVNQTTKGIFE